MVSLSGHQCNLHMPTQKTACVSSHVHSTCTSYVLYTYLYCVYVLVGGVISICDPYICAVHMSVQTNCMLSSTGPLSVQ